MSFIIVEDVIGEGSKSLYTETDDAGRDVPVVYDTIELARQELADLVAEQQAEVEAGERDPDECDTPDAYRILPCDPITRKPIEEPWPAPQV